MSFLGQMSFNFEALEFSIAIHIFDHGFTDFKVTPFGTVRAKTHIAPVNLTIALENIDINLLQTMLKPTLIIKRYWKISKPKSGK